MTAISNYTCRNVALTINYNLRLILSLQGVIINKTLKKKAKLKRI